MCSVILSVAAIAAIAIATTAGARYSAMGQLNRACLVSCVLLHLAVDCYYSTVHRSGVERRAVHVKRQAGYCTYCTTSELLLLL
jgi:hypothetical protein